MTKQNYKELLSVFRMLDDKTESELDRYDLSIVMFGVFDLLSNINILDIYFRAYGRS